MLTKFVFSGDNFEQQTLEVIQGNRIFVRHFSFHDGSQSHPAKVRLFTILDYGEADIATLNIPLDGEDSIIPSTIFLHVLCDNITIETDACITVGVNWDEVKQSNQI